MAPCLHAYHGCSMAGVFRQGDCLIVETIPFASLAPGDVIIFRQSSGGAEINVVHRVIAQHGQALITQGDQSVRPDPPVTADRLIGRVTACIRQASRHTVAGGPDGLLVAQQARRRKRLRGYLGRLLRLPYACLRDSGLVACVWRPRLRVLELQAGAQTIRKLVHRSTTVALWDREVGEWVARKPYDLLMPPRERPAHSVMPFVILSALTATLVFWGNHRHQFNQGGSTFQRSLLLAERLVAGQGYTLAQPDGTPAFYPMWGYPLLLAPGVWLGAPLLWITLVQFVLCGTAFWAFYRIFGLRPRLWHIPCLLPLFALCSVKWPDAVTLPLLLLLLERATKYLEDGRPRAAVGAAALFGLSVNVRSEFLLLPVCMLGLAWATRRGGDRKRWLALTGGLLLGGAVFLAPWAARSQALLGQWRLSSTNGGGVLYITLGQLPGNPWGIRHADAEAWTYVQARGLDSPWSPAGDAMLRAAWLERVVAHPFAFAGKVLGNGLRLATHGVYTGEYYTLIASPQAARSAVQALREGRWPVAWSAEDPVTGLLIIASATVYACFVLLLPLVLVTACACLCKHGYLRSWPGALAVSALLIHGVSLVLLAQHQTRHVNGLYLLGLGLTLRMAAQRRGRSVSHAVDLGSGGPQAIPCQAEGSQHVVAGS